MIIWASRLGTRDFYSALAALVSPVQKLFSSPYTISICVSPHRPSTWTGRRAGPPVSECVSPAVTVFGFAYFGSAEPLTGLQ